MLDLIWLVPGLPLAGFLVLTVAGRRIGEPGAGWLATGALTGSFLVTVGVHLDLAGRAVDDRRSVTTLFEWVPAGDLSVDVGFLVDPLALTMCLFITGVGALIHMYAIGYMHGDVDFGRFFAYMNLFAFAMLMLVLGDSLLLTFLGWEGVGACSYLLISFWFTDEANASAGKKAFITNRIGDWGFMVAMFATFFAFGSLDYVDVLDAAAAGTVAQTTATLIAVMLFVGAVGKSAQFPLHLWLPDAMAGPTPVSALIHAATMVTSGVYLLTRVNPLIADAAGWVPDMIAWVGVGTALFAATAALAQTDIKKVLAYSTISQLGYMFLAVGTGAYVAAVFHMITHAFFKALLFLGAGSVIHGMDGDQDLRHYGGLRRFMPVTATTFIIGWLAIAGVPPFAGFWSKNEILAFAWDRSPALWLVGLVTAVLTAFYMTRQVALTFFGRYRYPEPRTGGEDPATVAARADHRPHESPLTMTLPLVVLAVLAIGGGLMQLPFSSSTKRLEAWLEPSLFGNEVHLGLGAGTQWVLAAVAVVGGAVGIALALVVYLQRRISDRAIERPLLADAWRFDRYVSGFMGGPGRRGFEATTRFDERVVDGAVWGVAGIVSRTAGVLRLFHNGMVRTYAAGIGVGAVALLIWFLTRSTL